MSNVIQLTNMPDIEELLEDMSKNIGKTLTEEEKQLLLNEIIKLRNLNAYLQIQIDNVVEFLKGFEKKDTKENVSSTEENSS